jgi:hypothetical protein
MRTTYEEGVLCSAVQAGNVVSLQYHHRLLVELRFLEAQLAEAVAAHPVGGLRG